MNWLNAAWLSIFFFWFCLEPYLEIVNKDIETLIRCGIHHKREARNEMISIISQIQQFALKYTSFLNEDQSRTNLDGNQFEINVNVRSDMELCSLFFVAVGVLTFLQYYVLVGVVVGLGRFCDRFRVLSLIVRNMGGCCGGEIIEKIHECVCRSGTLK